MKIIKITDQHRRDFKAVYKCEGCGHEEKAGGYDDRNFHNNVIPEMKCKGCGKTRNGLGIKNDPTPTKYDPWEVV